MIYVSRLDLTFKNSALSFNNPIVIHKYCVLTEPYSPTTFKCIARYADDFITLAEMTVPWCPFETFGTFKSHILLNSCLEIPHTTVREFDALDSLLF